jgi:predicted transcriptional regulator
MIKSRKNGESYYTYRLVESERVKGRMKQRIVLNLGHHFENPTQEWRSLSRDRNTTRATLGRSLAVSAFPLYVPV